MHLFTPTRPPFDPAEWAAKPFAERAKLSVQTFGLIGNGQPLATYLFYAFKLVFYWAGWVFFCSFSEGLGSFTPASWWLDPVAFQKAVVWTTLYEVVGLGCGSGPLTGRFRPMFAAWRHWLWPGTTKLPLFEGAPLVGGMRRTWLDVLLYAALLATLLRALVVSEPGYGEWLPMVVLLPVLGIVDKPIFLAARGEHYWVLMVVFAFADDWIAGAKALWLALWFFAGVSKLNGHFPTVVAVMTSNSPFTPFERMRRAMYRNYPDDMRPSSTAKLHAAGGIALELSIPWVMIAAMATQDRTILIAGVVMLLALHAFILSNVPVGVPIEWNFVMVYGGIFLFYLHPEVTPLDLDSAPVAVLLVVTCLVVPIVGNFFPAKVSFLLAMRYYAGNWPISIYLFRDESYRKLDKLVKAAPWIDDQVAQMQPDLDPSMRRFALSTVVAFRLLHLHGRALHTLLPRVVDDVERYRWVDGEMIAGLALGWNFGDGHLHDEQLVRALQTQCGFEEGELRCIFLESQPLLGTTQAYRLYDARTGSLGTGEFPVEEMKALQPWPREA